VHRALALCLLAGCQTELATVPCPGFRAEPWPEADRLFVDARWQGASSATSLDLGEGRILWLFGESVFDGARVSNSLAIQTGLDPQTATMEFHGQLFPDQGPRELRPLGGVRLGPGVLLWFALGETDGWTGFWIPNPDESPLTWRREEAFLPLLRFPVVVGTALVVDGRYVYAFAHRAPGDHRGYLARFDQGDAQGVDLSRPQWWNGDWVAHTAFVADQPSLFPGEEREQPTALSVSPSPEGFLAVHTLGASIGVRTAPTLTGPWSPACSALRVGDLDGAQAHAAIPGAVTAIVDGAPHFFRLVRTN
jgi:hypothetical protein